MVKKKEFRAGVYSVAAGIAVAVVVIALCIFSYTARYNALDPEKVAQSYVDGIVQTGDGYNSYKTTLMSKNYKYGDFIREFYMNQYVNEDVEDATFSSTDEEAELLSEYYDTMYDYYVMLIKNYGWDNYDVIFTNYVAEAVSQRFAIYGTQYMTTDILFAVLEANVSTYGDSLTGTEDTYDSNTGVQLTQKALGIYQQKYGEDYSLTCTVMGSEDVDTQEYVASMNQTRLDTYEISTDDITAVKSCTVDVTVDDGTVVATQNLYLVKIGKSWYVDNTNIDTSGLYDFYNQ